MQILNDKGTRTTVVSSTIDAAYSNCGNKMNIVNGIAQNIYSSSSTPQTAVEIITMCVGDCKQAMDYCMVPSFAMHACFGNHSASHTGHRFTHHSLGGRDEQRCAERCVPDGYRLPAADENRERTIAEPWVADSSCAGSWMWISVA